MNYSIYLLLSLTAAFAAAVACLGVLWLLAPRLLARAGAGAFPRESEAVPAEKPPAPREEPATSEAGLTLALRREQLPALASLLGKETPEDIAIVISLMPPRLRDGLLSLLDKELAHQALVSLASPRSVEGPMLAGLKAEIESRLGGIVGGAAEAAELIAARPYAERKEIARRLEQGDPKLVSEARALIILDEDLLSLSEKDLGTLAVALPPAEMAEILDSLPEKLRGKIKERLSARALELAERAGAKPAPSAKKKDEALEKFMAAAVGLVAAGRISRPAVSLKAPAPAARAAAKDSEW